MNRCIQEGNPGAGFISEHSRNSSISIGINIGIQRAMDAIRNEAENQP